MKRLKKLAGMIGLVILLCGIMTGCSGKRLYSEEELTQIHDVVGAVEQITKEPCLKIILLYHPPGAVRVSPHSVPERCILQDLFRRYHPA